MKNLKIYSAVLVVFLLCTQTDLFAQPNRGHKQAEKNRKEYYKKQDKNKKHYQKNKKYYQKRYKEDRHDSYSKRKHKDDRRYSHSKRKRKGPPSWARAHGYHAKQHVYFRDYYTFYDPYRGGYVYRHQNRWLFSSSVPTFLVGVNLNNARVQFMSDIPLDRHPEQYYSQYSDRYPRDSRVNINISF